MSPEPLMNGNPSNKDLATIRVLTWQDLSQHNTRDDAYVSIRGKVYDITNFISSHPGGEDTLLLGAGRDVTSLFETYHPLVVAQRLIKYEVGILSSNELPVFPKHSPFFAAVKKRVAQYFTDTQQDCKNNTFIWIRYACLLLALLLSYYFQFFNATIQASIYLQLGVAVFFGLCAAEVGMHSLHDGSHFNITHSPTIWKMMASTHDVLNGCSHLVWMYQHTLGHHPYTNIDEADPDVVTGNPDFRRIKPPQKWYHHYPLQYLYGPIMYGGLAMKTRIQEFPVLFVKKANEGIRVNPISQKDLLIFWGGKAFFLTYRIVIPAMFSHYSLGKVLLLLFVADIATSYCLALFFQVSHIVEDVVWPLPDDDNFIDMDWAEMQLMTTQDYAHESRFWTLTSGALNYQAIHHLFPQVHQYYYPEIGAIIKDTCKEFGYSFLYKDTFWEALSSHVGHLKHMGDNPRKEL